MNSILLTHEPLIRFGFFFGILILMAVWELLAPRRQLQTPKSMRWFSNLGIVSIRKGESTWETICWRR